MKKSNKNIVFSKVRSEEQLPKPQRPSVDPESEVHELAERPQTNPDQHSESKQQPANASSQQPSNAFKHAEMYNYALTLQNQQQSKPSYYRTSSSSRPKPHWSDPLGQRATIEWLDQQRKIRDKAKDTATSYRDTMKEFQAQQRHHACTVNYRKTQSIARQKVEEEKNRESLVDHLDRTKLQFVNNQDYTIVRSSRNTLTNDNAFGRATLLIQQAPKRQQSRRKSSVGGFCKAAGQRVVDQKIRKLMEAVCAQTARKFKQNMLAKSKQIQRTSSSRIKAR